MGKDLSKQLVKVMNEIEEVKKSLVIIDAPSKTVNKLESALKRLNEIAAFYKIQ